MKKKLIVKVKYAIDNNDSIIELLNNLITIPLPSRQSALKIWIDVASSSHVFFFKPIIEELEVLGHSVSITAKDYADTTRLLRTFQIPYSPIRTHTRSQNTKKVTEVIKRGAHLVTYAKDMNFDLALAFDSPSLALAAKILCIPSVEFMDDENQPLHYLTMRLCDKVVIPLYYPDELLSRYGASPKAIKYDGLKEQVYLSNFQPQQNYLRSFHIDEKKVIVTIRPPTTRESNQCFQDGLFYEIVKYLVKNRNATVIAITHSEEQRRTFASFGQSDFVVSDKCVDKRNLLYFSDIVLSADGIINREAAVLGIPTYTIFNGQLSAVDRHLINLGRITPIQSYADMKKINIEKTLHKKALINPNLSTELTQYILSNGGD